MIRWNVIPKSVQRARKTFCVAGCLMLLVPVISFAQTANESDGKRAVMKIEESTHKYTPENKTTEQIIVSKIYDSGDSLGNSYLIRVNRTGKAIVIDPGYNYEAIVKYLEKIDVELESVLLTSGHFLRIAGNEELHKRWPNATILVGEKDAELLTDPKANMSAEFGGVTSPIANVWLNDGDTFEIAGIPLMVVGTPGYTPGSVTYVLATDDNSIAFTGDFIYKEGISSANLPSSSESDLQKSLDRFLETQYAETLVFPGYGENTSVATFYEQMTGKSIAVIDSSDANDDSPVIIVERDPQTTVLTNTVYVPTIEYRTETIVVDNYVRPWVAFGIGLSFWDNWYRPWHGYHYHHHMPPHYRPPYWGGGYPPPLIVPSRPGRPDIHPGGHRPPIHPGGNGPVIRPPRPDQNGPSRPDINRPGLTPGTRPTPGIVGGNRPIPGTRPNDRPVPGTRPGNRPIPGTITRPESRPTPNVRPGATIRPESRPTPNVRPGATIRPESRPTPNVRPGATARPEGRPAPNARSSQNAGANASQRFSGAAASPRGRATTAPARSGGGPRGAADQRKRD